MIKIPKLEINCIPSKLNTSAPTGVASQLANVAKNEPHYDEITVDLMRGNPLYNGVARDNIDIVGQAKKAMIDATKVVKSKRGVIRKVNDYASKMYKPKN